MKCMIVDDDLIARKSLGRLCQKVDGLEVVSVCENARQALDDLVKEPVDLIFLDVEMPGLTGFDFLEHAVNVPQVILTTAKEEYAFTAFQYDVTDYLKKPILLPRFKQAIEKANIALQQNPSSKTVPKKEVYLKENGKFIRVSYEDILYFENVGDYVKVKTITGHHLVHSTLKGIEAKLDDPDFLKVHRSYIVNLNKIKDIQENTLVIDRKVIPISRANKPLLMNRLNLL